MEATEEILSDPPSGASAAPETDPTRTRTVPSRETTAGPPDSRPTCAEVLADADPLILSKIVVETGAPDRQAARRRLFWPAVIGAGVALLPLVLDQVFRIFGHGSSLRGTGWLVLVAALDAGLLILPRLTWRGLVERGERIDDLLPDETNREVAAWIAARMRPWFHVPLCVLGALLGIAGTAAADHFGVHFEPAYYVAMALTGFFGADAVHWLLRAPWLLRRLYRYEPLCVNPLAPVDTPAVREMSSLLTWTAVQAAGGTLLFAAPLLWVVLTAGGDAQLELGLLCLAPGLVALGTLAYITYMPEWWLSKIVGREQNRILNELVIGTPPADLVGELDGRIALYEKIAASASRTAATKKIFAQTAVIGGVVTPYLLGGLDQFLKM